MLRSAGDHALLAGAADAELAGVVEVDAGIEQHVEDGLALGNEIFDAGARELHGKAAFLCRRKLLGGEIFDMDLIARPVLGRGLECLQHRRGTTTVQVRILRRGGDDRPDVEELPAALVVEMQRGLRHAFKLLPKRHVGARPAGIMELPLVSERVEPLHHAPDRRDPDPAGDQDGVRGVLAQAKVVARTSDLQRRADVQLVMDEARTAAARRIALDADRIGRRLRRGDRQRVVAQEPVGQMQVDMGAGLVGGQRPPVDAPEFVQAGVARHIADRGEADLDQSVGRRCRRRRGDLRGRSHGIHGVVVSSAPSVAA